MASFVPVEEDASFSVTGSNQNLAASISSTLNDVYLKMYGSENSNLSYVIGISNVTPTIPKFMIGKTTTSSSNIAPVSDFVLQEGNVGVGVTTPSKKLDVAGDINFVGGLYQNNSLFIDSDDSNVVIPNNIGIGTTSPQSRLHVVGDTLVEGHITPVTTETYDLGTSNARFRDIYLAGSSIYLGNTKITHSNAGIVSFQDATTSAYQDIRVKNIITEGSISACNLVDSAFIDTTNATNISSGTLSNARLPQNIAVATLAGDGASLSNLNATLITSGTLQNARLPSAFNVTTATETMVINNTGLRVNGDILSTGTLTASNLVVLGDTVTLNTVTSNTENMVINNAGSGPALKVIQSGANVVAEFYDAENATPALFIADGGNVGIGTSMPQTKLHVVGNAIATGNIGIGTTDPVGRLHVIGGTSIIHNMVMSSFNKTLSATALGWSSICTVGALHGAFIIHLDVVHSEGGSSEAKTYTIPHQFGAGAAGSWYTCLPISTGAFNANNWRVDITSDGYNATLRLVRESGIINTTNFTCTLRIAQSQNNQVVITDVTTTGTGATAVGIFESTRITQVDGNVGIGTTLPAYALDVVGSARVTSNLLVSNISGDGASLSNLNATLITSGTLDNARLPSAIAVSTLAGNGASLSNLNATLITAGTLANARLPSAIAVTTLAGDGSSLSNLNATLLTTGTLANARLPSAFNVLTGTQTITINVSSNVGIGTTTPLAKTHIYHTGSGDILRIDDSAAPDATPFIINQDGNAGIGITMPSAKLHVGGNTLLQTSNVNSGIVTGTLYNINVSDLVPTLSSGQSIATWSGFAPIIQSPIFQREGGYKDGPTAVFNRSLSNAMQIGAGINLTTGFTIGILCKFTGSATTTETVVDIGNQNLSELTLFRSSTTQSWNLYHSGGYSGVTFTNVFTNVPQNEWVSLVLRGTYGYSNTSSNLTINSYYNGISTSSNVIDITQKFANTQTAAFGGSRIGAGSAVVGKTQFNGEIAGFQFYPQPLTNSEITGLLNNYTIGNPTMYPSGVRIEVGDLRGPALQLTSYDSNVVGNSPMIRFDTITTSNYGYMNFTSNQGYTVGINTSSTSVLNLSLNGNVGIGTLVPLAKTHIYHTGAGDVLRVEDSAAVDSSPFIINADGNVGIGTTLARTALDVVGVATFSSNVNASSFAGDGASLSNLNATLITSGTISADRLPTTLTVSTIVGDGASLSNLNATLITSGTLNNARLPTNISVSTVAGDGASLSNLNATYLVTGTLANARLPTAISVSTLAGDGASLSNLNATLIASGTLDNARLPSSIAVSTLAGDGASLSNLNATLITSGTLDNTRLPTSIAVTSVSADGSSLSNLNATLLTTGTISNARLPTAIAVTTLAGDGASLSNLNATLLTTGTLNNGRLPADIAVTSVSADGASLSNLNATLITTGTLANARLPTAFNVSTSTETLVVNATGLGIGVIPQAKLHVAGDIISTGTMTASNLIVLGDTVTLNTVTSNTENMVINNAGSGPALKVIQSGANVVAEFYDAENAVPALFIADGGNVGIGTNLPLSKMHVQGTASVSSSLAVGTISGDGASLSNLNASLIIGGTLNNARLPSAIAVATLAGDGASLSNLNATLITTGTIANARLPTNIAVATLAGDGASLSNLNATLITGGTLASARLPTTGVVAASYGSTSNVATFAVDTYGRLTTASNVSISISAASVTGLATVATTGNYNSLSNITFTLSASNAIYTAGNVGIGTTNPSSKLHIHGGITQYGGTPATSIPKDDSGTYVSLTNVGSVTASAFTPNSATGSVYYGGAGNYTTFTGAANPANIYSSSFTMEAWIYNVTTPSTLTTADSDARPYLFGSMSPNNTTNYWSFGVNANNKVNWFGFFTNNGTFARIEGSSIVPLQRWTHIAVSYNSTTKAMQLFVNGVAETLTLVVLSGTTGITISTTTATFPVAAATGANGNATLGQVNNVSHVFYLTNFRILIGTSQNPTMTLPLTSITNTKLLLNSDIPAYSTGLQALTDGKVGIGTTAVASPFTVAHTGFSPLLTDASPQRDYALQVFANIPSSSYAQTGGIAFTNYISTTIASESNSAPGAAIVHERTGAYSLGKMHFKTRSGTLATDPCITRMTIDSDGNIGIGTTIPLARTHIYHVGVGDVLRVDDETAPDASPFIIKESGNIGIGTTTPDRRLDVYGIARFSSNVGAQSFTGDGASLSNLNATLLTSGTIASARLPSTIAVTSVSADGASLSNLNATLITSGTLNNARLPTAIAVSTLAGDGASLSNLNATLITTGTLANARLPSAINVSTSTQTITIDASTNVGIGTATALAKTHIYHTGASDCFRVDDGNAPDASPFVINQVGNVGIGTTDPLQKLQVDGNISVSGNLNNVLTKTISRSLAATALDWSEYGTITSFNGAFTVHLTVTQSQGGAALSKFYIFARNQQFSNSQWNLINPLSSSGKHGSEDWQIEIQNNYDALVFRVVRVSGTNVNNVSATFVIYGNSTNAPVFTESTLTGSNATNTGLWNGGAMIIQEQGNVGIGTIAPLAKTHIYNTGAGDAFRVDDELAPDTTPFVINQNGNVGIGMSMPLVALDVNGTISGTTLRTSTITALTSNINMSGRTLSNIADVLLGTVSGSGASLSNLNATLITSGTISSARLPSTLTLTSISADGASLSNLNATLITTGTLDANRLATSGVVAGSYGNQSTVSVITVDNKGRVTSASLCNIAIPTSAVTGLANVATTGDYNSLSNITFTLSGTTATYAGGNVGISTSPAVNKLDVRGNMAVGTYAGVTSAPTDSLIVSGNVGVGVNNPTSKLHVAGDIMSSGTLTASNLVIIGDTVTLNTVTSNTESMVINNAGTGPALQVVQTGAQPVARFMDDTNTALIIVDGGFVGINTSIPSQYLDVVGNARISGTVNASNFSGIGNSLSNLNATLITSGTLDSARLPSSIAVTSLAGDGASLSNLNATYLTTGTLANARLPTALSVATTTQTVTITSASNVGIGTTQPTEKLQVAGSIAVTGNVLPTSCNVYDLGSSNLRWKDLYLSGSTIDMQGTRISKDASTGGLKFVNNVGSNLDLQTSNIVALGNVGIGTTNSLRTLTVQGSATFGTPTDSVSTEYPPSALTSNINIINGITYTATASTILNSDPVGPYAAYKAFNKQAPNPYTGDENQWLSESRYNVTTGAYTGSVTTIVSGTPVYGEWVQLQIGTQINLGSIVHYAGGQVLSSPSRHPKTFKIAGSLDGTTWTLLVSQSNQSFPGLNVATTYNISATPISYLRFIVEATSGPSYGIYAEVGELVLMTVPTANTIMRITNLGYVGIGTSTPLYNLHVLGEAMFSSNIYVGTISGSAPSLSNLNATNLTSGTIANARLPSSIAVSTLAGDGASLSNLNASYITTGTIANARLPTAIAVTSLAGDGASLSNLNATYLTSGTLANARLPTVLNVATTTQTVTITAASNVGIGTTQPTEKLQVAGSIAVTGNVLPTSCNVYDLGSSNLRWKDLYLSGSTIDMQGTRISKDASTGGLKFVNANGSYLDLRTSNLNAFGNLGVGTSNALSTLTVQGSAIFGIPGDSVSTEYPPAALTSNVSTVSGVTYTSTASSVYDGNMEGSYAPYRAFNKIPPNSWVSYPEQWLSGPYYQNGPYSGSVFTVVNGTNLYGEWLQVQMSSSISLTSIVHYAGLAATSSHQRHPSNFTIVGSTDGSNWSVLVSQPNQSFPGFGVSTTYNVTRTEVSYIRFIVHSIVGLYNAEIGELVFISTPSSSRSVAINSIGSIGIGTELPLYKLHVLGEAMFSSNIYAGTISGSGPSLSNLNASYIVSGNLPSAQLPLALSVNTNTQSVTIASNGNVGIGTATANYKLHVQGKIFAADSITAYSDARIKSDVCTLTGALNTVSRLRGVGYMRIDTGEKQVGVIAQEVQTVLPEVVTEADNGLSVAYGNIVGVLIEAIKELTERVKILESQLS